MARERHVYPTNEIAHIWAHKTQEEARNKEGNFYFSGDTIYSYGSHFPIARHITHKGKAAILFTSRDYSVTTARHKSEVRQAIPSSIPTFEVYEVEDSYKNTAIQKGLVEHKKLVAQASKELKAANNKPSRVAKYKKLGELVAAANDFCIFFGYKTRFSYVPKGMDGAQLATEAQEYDAALEERRQRANEKRRAEHAAYQTRQQKEAEEWATKQPELMEQWRNGQNPPALVNNWYRLHSLPVMLRIVGDVVETSRGARFPVAHARLGLRLVRKCRETHTAYQRNGHTIHLGHYAIDTIDESGNVVAGCHHVSWEEIERLAPKLEAVQETTES